MLPLSSLVTVGLLAFIGAMTLWPSSPKVSPPLGDNSVHQLHVDRICHVYDAMLRTNPGLTSPPNLYDYLGVDKRGDDDAARIWRASASRANEYLNGRGALEKEVFLQASTVLLDQSTRSADDGTFWPAIEREPQHLKRTKLKSICGWV